MKNWVKKYVKKIWIYFIECKIFFSKQFHVEHEINKKLKKKLFCLEFNKKCWNGRN